MTDYREEDDPFQLVTREQAGALLLAALALALIFWPLWRHL